MLVATAEEEDEDEETRLTRLELAAMFADPDPILPTDEDRLYEDSLD